MQDIAVRRAQGNIRLAAPLTTVNLDLGADETHERPYLSGLGDGIGKGPTICGGTYIRHLLTLLMLNGSNIKIKFWMVICPYLPLLHSLLLAIQQGQGLCQMLLVDVLAQCMLVFTGPAAALYERQGLIYELIYTTICAPKTRILYHTEEAQPWPGPV